MICFLFKHRELEEVYAVVNAESKSGLPLGCDDLIIYKLLGFVDVPESSIVAIKLQQEDRILQVNEKMFEVIPELNQLINI